MSDPFYCELLRANENNRALIRDFTIYREAEYSRLPDKIIGLEAYLKKRAWNDDADDLVKIYLVKDAKTDEVVAYFGLKAGMLAASMDEALPFDEQRALFKSEGVKIFPEILPGVEISHFAVNDKYRDKLSDGGAPVKGLGRYLFPKYIYPIIMEVGAKIGIHMIYLFAAGDDSLVSYYKDAFDFQEMTPNDQYTPLEPKYDGGCTFMYQRFYSS